MLYAGSNIHALIGDDFTAVANSLTVNAQRPLVDESLYQFPFDWSDLLTINSAVNNPTNPEKGLFDITLPEQLNQITQIRIECTIGTDDVMDIFDMINYLAMVNYYVEAISGSLNTSAQTAANLAGTLAALFAGNSVRAEIGDNASLSLNKNDEGDGLSVTADSAATTRIIAGGVSIGAPKASVGAAVSLADISDQVSASIGDVTDGSKISSTGNVKVSANADNEMWNVTVADSSAIGGQNALTIGGGVNLVKSATQALARVGDGVDVTSQGDFSVNGDNHNESAIIAVSVGFATGNTNVAAGGTVAYGEFANQTGARLGDGAKVDAKSLSLTADSSEKLMHILASASGALQNTIGAAATVAVFDNSSETVALAGSGVDLTAREGDILVHAFDESKVLAALLGFNTGSQSSAAMGAAVLTQNFRQKALASVGISESEPDGEQSAKLTAKKGSILLESRADSSSIAGAAALAAQGQTSFQLAGTVITNNFSSQAISRMGDNTEATAYDSIGVIADGENLIVSAAGAADISGTGTVGLGASVNTLIMENAVEAAVGENSQLIAYALAKGADAGVKTSNRDERRKGVIVHAFSDEEIYMAAAAGSVPGRTRIMAGWTSRMLQSR